RTLQIPDFCIAPFLILRCNENYMASQQDFDWQGMTGATWRRLGAARRDRGGAERGAQSLMQRNLQIAAHFCADYTNNSLRTPPFHIHAMVTKPSDSRHFLR